MTLPNMLYHLSVPALLCLHNSAVNNEEPALQFKVPAQTSAILTNGKFHIFLFLRPESDLSTHALQINETDCDPY